MRLIKTIYGWRAESFIKIDDKHDLLISTYKNSYGKLVTTSSRVTNSEDGKSYTFVMFSDFIKWIFEEPVRCTEKAVKSQHEKALLQVSEILAECADFYAKKAENEEN